jgi:transposase
LQRVDAETRRHDLRAVFNALRYIVRAGGAWRLLPTNCPPWWVVYQQAQRWLAAGTFEAMVHDLRGILRMAEGRSPAPKRGDPR